MKLKPLSNRIVVQCEQAKKAESSLLVIPDTAADQPTRGVVIAVGPGKYVNGEIQPVDITVGQTVVFPKGTGTKTTIEKQDYFIMFDDDILGVVG